MPAAVVVPAVRLRRDTAGWSYLVPKQLHCPAGSLVIIPFRGRPTLGVVWETAADDVQATESVSQVLSRQPLVLAPHRQLIEYLAETGLCSLSTALYVWLPEWLRKLPLTALTKRQLQDMRSLDANQEAIVLPGRRPDGERRLESRQPAVLFKESTAADQDRWWSIQSGTSNLGVGRDGALFAPWRNLRRLTVVDPEDISLYHEQVPYLPLTGAAQELARAYRIKAEFRSCLPGSAAKLLWGGAAKGVDTIPQISHTDLRAEPILDDALIERIRNARAGRHQVLILYNAHDALGQPDEQGRRKPLPGVESLRKQLEQRLGSVGGIVLDTRAMFHSEHQNVGLTVALNLDHLMETSLFADQLHGWGDLGHLFRYGAPCVIQSHAPDDPLVRALLQGTWSQYVLDRVQSRQAAGLPPFSQQIALSMPSDPDAAAELHRTLLPLLRDPWQLSFPFQSVWRKAEYSHLMLSAPLGKRLPAKLRQEIVSLKRPWKVQRDPWHIL